VVSRELLNSMVKELVIRIPVFTSVELKGNEFTFTWDSCKTPGSGLLDSFLLHEINPAKIIDKKKARVKIFFKE
jgi:hypothetical protein